MLNVFEHERSKSTIPWAPPDQWQAVNRAIRFHCDRYPENFKSAVSLAQKTKRRLQTIFPVLDEMCADSCPWCPEPCCLKASVWFDFKDLLFLHFNEQPIPPAQPKANLNMPCRYLGSRGCRLPRMTRPWICTWYLCPTQKDRLRKEDAAAYDRLEREMKEIGTARKQMLAVFLQAVCSESK